jgi:hypothetical protein
VAAVVAVVANDPDWQALLEATAEPPAIMADRHERGPISGSFSRPHVYSVGGVEYVVKLRRPGQTRAVASEQEVGRAGTLIGEAVAEVAAIEISAALLPSGEDQSAAGTSHGCRVIPSVIDGGVMHLDANRSRFGSLTVLYTWTFADNQQLIYSTETDPPTAYSVDHGHFLPPATAWDGSSLDAHPDPSALEPYFTSEGITVADCEPTARRLRDVGPEDIAALARSARSEWGVTDSDRLALCRYLWRRREATVALAELDPDVNQDDDDE